MVIVSVIMLVCLLALTGRQRISQASVASVLQVDRMVVGAQGEPGSYQLFEVAVVFLVGIRLPRNLGLQC